jgi:hyperosmotically inducible periplasmic protein
MNTVRRNTLEKIRHYLYRKGATMIESKTNYFAISMLAAVSAMVLTLAGCDKTTQSGETVGQKVDKAIDKTNETVAAAGDKMGAQMDKAGAAISSGASSLSTDASSTAAKAGDVMSDAAITASINADLLKDPDLSVLKIDVDTKMGAVVLNGLTPSEEARARAEKIATAVKGVTKVDNKLTVKKS